MNTPALIPFDAIVYNHNQIRTTSLKVAQAFGKRHTNVLRKIEALECSPEFNELHFELVEYKDAKGEKRPSYEMTKDGFMFLVMGFTGQKAAQIKEAYINAFNRMAAQLQQTSVPHPQLTPAMQQWIDDQTNRLTLDHFKQIRERLTNQVLDMQKNNNFTPERATSELKIHKDSYRPVVLLSINVRTLGVLMDTTVKQCQKLRDMMEFQTGPL